MKRWVLVVMLAACQRTAQEPPLFTVKANVQAGAPVLVLLHGYGANENDLMGLQPVLDPRFELIGVRAPIALPGGGYAWFRSDAELLESRAKVIALLEGLKGRKVFLLGFSQGATLIATTQQARPDLMAGAVAIGAKTLSDVVRGGVEKPPLLLMHGSRDQRVPYENAVQLEAALKATGASVELKTYDAGHEISPQMRADLDTWLTRQLDRN